MRTRASRRPGPRLAMTLCGGLLTSGFLLNGCTTPIDTAPQTDTGDAPRAIAYDKRPVIDFLIDGTQDVQLQGARGFVTTVAQNDVRTAILNLRVLPEQADPLMFLPVQPQTLTPDRTLALELAQPPFVPEDMQPVDRPQRILVYALDIEGRTLFTGSLSAPPDSTTYLGQLHRFAWGVDRAGEWNQVESLALRFTGLKAGQSTSILSLDARRPQDDTNPWPSTLLASEAEQLGTPPSWTLVNHQGLILVSDVPASRIPARDLEALAMRTTDTVAWLMQRAGLSYDDSLDTIATGEPMHLFIFERPEPRQRFLMRVTSVWGATLDVSRNTQGFTVQDIGTVVAQNVAVTIDPAFTRELAHVLLARHLHLLAGAPHMSWLHQGLAAYIQLVTHPASAAPDAMVNLFSLELDATPYMVSLNTLIHEPITRERVLQAASLVGYLLDREPAMLGRWLTTVSQGGSVGDMLAAEDLTLLELQADWLAWGQRVYLDAPAAPPRHFPRVPPHVIPPHVNDDVTTPPVR